VRKSLKGIFGDPKSCLFDQDLGRDNPVTCLAQGHNKRTCGLSPQ